MEQFPKSKSYSWLLLWACLVACAPGPSQELSDSANDSNLLQSAPNPQYDSTESGVWKPEITPELVAFIPEGYVILYQFDNDLNLDSIKDIALVLEIDTSLNDTHLENLFGIADNIELSLDRPFLILIRQKDGTLKQAARSDLLFSARTHRFMMLSIYFPEPDVSDGQFGFSGFFFHGGNGHSESDIRFEYSRKYEDWLLVESRYSYTSDTPTEEGGYDNHEGSYHRTQKDFGIIRINEFDESTE